MFTIHYRLKLNLGMHNLNGLNLQSIRQPLKINIDYVYLGSKNFIRFLILKLIPLKMYILIAFL